MGNGTSNVNGTLNETLKPENVYFLAAGGQSCKAACALEGDVCNASALKVAASSLFTCKSIIETLGKTPQEGGEYPDDNSGCTYHPGDQGWYQVMRKDADPVCAAVNSDPSRQRV